jgi:hypothetical protein
MPRLNQPEGKFNEHFSVQPHTTFFVPHIINKNTRYFIKQKEKYTILKFFAMYKGKTVATFAYYIIKQIFK